MKTLYIQIEYGYNPQFMALLVRLRHHAKAMEYKRGGICQVFLTIDLASQQGQQEAEKTLLEFSREEEVTVTYLNARPDVEYVGPWVPVDPEEAVLTFLTSRYPGYTLKKEADYSLPFWPSRELYYTEGGYKVAVIKEADKTVKWCFGSTGKNDFA